MEYKDVVTRLQIAEKALEKIEPKECSHNDKCECPKCEYFKKFPFLINSSILESKRV